MGVKTSALRSKSMKTQNTTTYIVRFQYYMYNTGSANNGYASGYVEFESLERAEEIWGILEERIQENDTRSFLDSHLGVDGFIESLDALYRIEVIKISDDIGIFQSKLIETRVKP